MGRKDFPFQDVDTELLGISDRGGNKKICISNSLQEKSIRQQSQEFVCGTQLKDASRSKRGNGVGGGGRQIKPGSCHSSQGSFLISFKNHTERKLLVGALRIVHCGSK